MNIYLRVLTRVSGAKWSVGEPIAVVDDSVTTFESDQLLPALDVDEDGGIHIIFYDDRNYTDPDDPNDPIEDQQPDSEFYPWRAHEGTPITTRGQGACMFLNQARMTGIWM